jgi:hypothetical protein
MTPGMPDDTQRNRLDLQDLGFDRGADLLVDHALAAVPVGGALEVVGRDHALKIHLSAWARGHGHRIDVNDSEGEPIGAVVVKGSADTARWAGAERAGNPAPGAVQSQPSATWGLAPRGALVEAGGPTLRFSLETKESVWADAAPRLYAQAAANQWDPATAVDWDATFALSVDVESAVVQVMTYLVENEQAALLVPARFLGRIHPHFREVLQFLSTQVADEARHAEVFTRRALLRGGVLGVSGAGGRASLGTLLEEQEFAEASFLLSVMGEGTFLNLLSFLEAHAPDSVTAHIAGLVLQDEARHVAFALGHLEQQLAVQPELRDGLRLAVERRHNALRDTAGLNSAVFDALVVLAAGAWTPQAIGAGYAAVQELQLEMAAGREHRLIRLGFPPAEAAFLSGLHTRNFM